MTLTPEQARELLRQVRATREHELACDECERELAEFVETRVAGKPLSEVQRALADHLKVCQHCCDEYYVLKRAVEAMEEEE